MKDGSKLEQLQQVKVVLLECYMAEAKLVGFLMECLEKYGSGLPVDETFKVKWLSDKIYALLQKVDASDEKYHQDNSDDKVPLPALDKLITSNFDPIMRFRNTESRTHSVYGIACANVTEGAEIRKSIENQPGVRTVRMNIVEQLVHVYDWLESQVSRMVTRSSA